MTDIPRLRQNYHERRAFMLLTNAIDAPCLEILDGRCRLSLNRKRSLSAYD